MYAKGRLRYDPTMPNHRDKEPWWLVLECDPELGRYYRELVEVSLWRTVSLMRPAWGTHVSILRGEAPRKNEDKWAKDAGRVLEFEYEPVVLTNGKHWWLKVECPGLAEVRRFYGLGSPRVAPHLTIGNLPGQQREEVPMSLRDFLSKYALTAPARVFYWLKKFGGRIWT
jgi:hypothetical protein